MAWSERVLVVMLRPMLAPSLNRKPPRPPAPRSANDASGGTELEATARSNKSVPPFGLSIDLGDYDSSIGAAFGAAAQQQRQRQRQRQRRQHRRRRQVERAPHTPPRRGGGLVARRRPARLGSLVVASQGRSLEAITLLLLLFLVHVFAALLCDRSVR